MPGDTSESFIPMVAYIAEAPAGSGPDDPACFAGTATGALTSATMIEKITRPMTEPRRQPATQGLPCLSALQDLAAADAQTVTSGMSGRPC